MLNISAKTNIKLVANRNLFVKLIIITQKRSIDLKEVFKYSLGPFPWALAGSVGDLKKTNKAALLHELEKNWIHCSLII